MIKVYFTGKSLRQRRKETILNPPQGISFTPERPLTRMKHDYTPTTESKRSLFRTLIRFLRIPNVGYVPKRAYANHDVIYTTGKLLLNRRPYVIEIDNVACLGLYTYNSLFNPLTYRIIKRLLKSHHCKRLICISEAARNSVINTFNDAIITAKCTVIYPYVKRHDVTRPPRDHLIFLCCNRKFHQKATQNVIEAFASLSAHHPRAELWIVSNTPDDVKKKYALPNIKYFEPTYNKEQLYTKFYSQADVFIQPTLQDSFGMVYFETMANKMAIISTDVFAIPEFVQHERNGLLVTAPFYMFDKKFRPVKKYFPRPANLYEQYAHDTAFTDRIRQAMQTLLESPEIVRNMQETSMNILNTRPFTEAERLRRLSDVLHEAAQKKTN